MGTMVTKMAAAGAAAAAAVVARRAVEYGWVQLKGEEPPTADDVRGDTELRDLLLWSAVLTGAVLVARKLATSTTDKLLGDAEA